MIEVYVNKLRPYTNAFVAFSKAWFYQGLNFVRVVVTEKYLLPIRGEAFFQHTVTSYIRIFLKATLVLTHPPPFVVDRSQAAAAPVIIFGQHHHLL
jgi:hypothetical protein